MYLVSVFRPELSEPAFAYPFKGIEVVALVDDEVAAQRLIDNFNVPPVQEEASKRWQWMIEPITENMDHRVVEKHDHVLGLTHSQALDIISSVDTMREAMTNPSVRGRLTALLDNLAAQLHAIKEDK